MTKSKEELKKDEEEKAKARAWLLGQELAKRSLVGEAVRANIEKVVRERLKEEIEEEVRSEVEQEREREKPKEEEE